MKTLVDWSLLVGGTDGTHVEERTAEVLRNASIKYENIHSGQAREFSCVLLIQGICFHDKSRILEALGDEFDILSMNFDHYDPENVFEIDLKCRTGFKDQ